MELNKDVESYLKLTYSQNEEHFERLLKALSTCPLFTTLRIIPEHLDRDLKSLRDELNKQCTALNWDVFQPFLHPALKDCLVIQNRGPYDLNKPCKEIIVDSVCGMAVMRGANVFKQGILAAPHSMRKGDLVAVFSDLDGKCLKGTASTYQGKKIHVGNGISQVSREDIFNAKEIQTGVGILMTEPIFQAPSLSDLDPAVFFPQNLPSIVCSHILDPQPGEVILDMCAAPGGKTFHIASLMKEEGRVIALEKSKQRVIKMQQAMQRMGSGIIETYTFDSTKAVLSGEGEDGGPPYPPAMFDRILLDAPCSALGQRPCLANRITLSQMKSFPVVQRKLLTVAVELLKPGGVLVYSTCSLPCQENEDQVCHVLNTCPDMELVQAPFATGKQVVISSQLTPEQRSKVMRFDPVVSSEDKTDDWDKDTIGFFIAKFVKTQHNLKSE